MHLKLLQKKVVQKTEEATVDLIGNEIANRIIVSKKSQQINSETVTNKHDKEISKKIYISPEETQKIIGNLRL